MSTAVGPQWRGPDEDGELTIDPTGGLAADAEAVTAGGAGARTPAARPLLDRGVLARLETDAKTIVGRYPKSRSALLPMLHLVQAEEGFVSSDGIEFCARMLDLTTAEVSAVATFYTMYKRRPGGDYTVGVCTNTLCAVLGGDAIYARLRAHPGVGPDGTTDDGTVSVEHLECNAACDYAPVVMVNWEFFDNQTPESAVELVDRLRAGDIPQPSRGASLGTFREISRVLAGFYDGRADEGVSAGPATLAGHALAAAQHDGDRVDTSRGPGRDAPAEEIATTSPTGYGRPTGDGRAGPSSSDAGVATSASDPANSQPAASQQQEKKS